MDGFGLLKLSLKRLSISEGLVEYNNMYGSVRDIAGSAVQSVPQLELNSLEDD
jgi:hypothetical protein